MLAKKLKSMGGPDAKLKRVDFFTDIKSAPSGGTLETAMGIMFGAEGKAKPHAAVKAVGFDPLLKLSDGNKSVSNLAAKNVAVLQMGAGKLASNPLVMNRPHRWVRITFFNPIHLLIHTTQMQLHTTTQFYNHTMKGLHPLPTGRALGRSKLTFLVVSRLSNSYPFHSFSFISLWAFFPFSSHFMALRTLFFMAGVNANAVKRRCVSHVFHPFLFWSLGLFFDHE
jgi:hypothetical protein